MLRYYVLNAISVLLIAFSLSLSLWGSRYIHFTYEISVLLSFFSLILFVISAFKRKKAPSVSPVSTINTSEKKRKTESAIGFSDVAANESALKSLKELVDFLKSPEKYARLGARIPHGVLLYGPPGTGKTLLARALAGEAGVPFIAMNGSDFVEMYVGVGASRVRETFKKARKHGKCVVFIDEIDTLGRSRSLNSSEERDQTLNALLSEMSGFSPSSGIIVIGATNRWEMLDPALLRPGRFDRQIEVGMPGLMERVSILKLHAKNKPVSKEIDFLSLASLTAFFSGASLENLMNEAAIRAARRNASVIEKEDFDEAYIAIVAGEDGSSHQDTREKEIIAVHEAGHTLAARQLFGKSIRRISILPSSGGAAGYNLMIPEEKSLYTKLDLEKKILVLLAGRCAEQIVFSINGITTGASEDIKRAGEIALSLAGEMGFQDHPAIHENTLFRYYGARGDMSEKVRNMLCTLYEEAVSFLDKNRNTLLNLANELLLKETMAKDEIDRFFKDNPICMSSENNDSAKEDDI